MHTDLRGYWEHKWDYIMQRVVSLAYSNDSENHRSQVCMM